MEESSDFDLLIVNQQRELVAASAIVSDNDLAFRLQMEEALAASAAVAASATCSSASGSLKAPLTIPSSVAAETSSSTAVSIDADLSQALDLQSMELSRFQQERRDAELSRTELLSAANILRLRAHDEQLAREIKDMPDDEWDEYGDNVERPIELLKPEDELPFILYFKGMMKEILVRVKPVKLASIGVAICDPRGDILLKIQKPVPVPVTGTSQEGFEAKALIEGLNAVVELGIKNLDVYFDSTALLNHINGKWKVKQTKIMHLISQVQLLQRKLDRCRMFLLPRCSVQFVFQLASEVIDSQLKKDEPLIQGNTSKDRMEVCNICLDLTDCSHMFRIFGCGHRFCFNCMRQHVEVRLLHGMLPSCPHLGCNVRLEVENCRSFLSSRLLKIMCQRLKEDSIPPNEKVYCPYPRCSALMSKSEAIPRQQPCSSKQKIAEDSGLRKCIACNNYFCINCKVPWHEWMSCYEYKRSNPHQSTEDVRLQSLARQKLWRQCVKCSHMIELAEGCYHMTCRCGYQFCYTCGAEWIDKKATCSCPLWEERFIFVEGAGQELDNDYYESDEYDEPDEDDHY